MLRSSIHVANLSESRNAEQVIQGRRPRWSPDSKLLALLDKQVSIYDVATRATRVVTNSPTPVTSYSWSPAGDAIVYLANDDGTEPDPIVADHDYRYSRLYWQSLTGGASKLLTKSDRHVVSFAISPDASHAVYAAQPTPRNRDAFNVDLYELDLRTGTEKTLVAQPGRDADPSYSPDGRWICFHSQTGSQNYFEARNVAIVPSGGGTIRYLTAQHDFDVFRNGNVFTWSPDSRTLLFTAGKGVQDILVSHNLQSGEAQVLSEEISGAASFTSDGSQAVLLKTSPTRPPEVFLRRGNSERQLTHVQDGVAAYPLIHSEVVRWKSSDGLPMEGILWLPVDYRPGARVPLLTELHGGPTGVTLNAFPIPRVYPIQVFLQQGIAVFSPNFRGSCNYGAAFRLKNALSQGIGDYADVMSGIDSLVSRGIADPKRLGVMGWSYGGYLTGSGDNTNEPF